MTDVERDIARRFFDAVEDSIVTTVRADEATLDGRSGSKAWHALEGGIDVDLFDEMAAMLA